MLVIPALIFVAHYLLAMLACGAAVWRVTIGRDPTPRTVDERRRLTIAAFLIGTALAPFLIGCFQGVLWFGLRRQPMWVYALLEFGWVVVALVICRAWLQQCLGELVAAVRTTPTSRLGSLILLIVLGFVSAHAAFHALSPLRQYDATTYALDARRLAEHRSWAWIMAHDPRDESNQFANHNHGSSYQSYLSSSLIYGRDPRQDFPLRVAQRILAIHCVVVLIGLGLRVGWAAAVIAPVLLLSYVYFGSLTASASRDFFRVLPFMFIVGMFRLNGWPGFNWQGALIGLGFCFLWNSHASSLMIAPTLLGCMLLLCLTRPMAIASLILGFAISVPLVALRLVRSWLETGDPLHFSPMHNLNYLGTAIIEPWFIARGTNPSGLAHAGERLVRQFVSDGGVMVVLLWVSLAVFLVWCAANLIRRRPLAPPMLLLIAGYVLFSMLMLVGALDVVSERLSMTFSMNSRYRAHVYPLAVVLGAFVMWELIRPWISRISPRLMNGSLIGLLVVMLLVAARSWEGHHAGFHLDTRAANRHLAEEMPYYRWASLLRSLDKRETALMDYAYLGWYQTDNRIMFTQDPRLRGAFTATTMPEAMGVLDSFDVRFVYMIELERRAILESGVPLGAALQSPQFELVMSEPGGWYLYRRVAVATKPAPADFAPPPGLRPVPELVWSRARPLLALLERDTIEKREEALVELLKLGPWAAPAAARMIPLTQNEKARSLLVRVIDLQVGGQLLASEALDIIEADTRSTYSRRCGLEPADRAWTGNGPQFAGNLRRLALARGVTLASSAGEFFDLLNQRSIDRSERFIVQRSRAVGGEQDILAWMTRMQPRDDVAAAGAARP